MKKFYERLGSLSLGKKLALGTLAVVFVTTSTVSAIAFTDSDTPNSYLNNVYAAKEENQAISLSSVNDKQVKAATYDKASSKTKTDKVKAKKTTKKLKKSKVSKKVTKAKKSNSINTVNKANNAATENKQTVTSNSAATKAVNNTPSTSTVSKTPIVITSNKTNCPTNSVSNSNATKQSTRSTYRITSQADLDRILKEFTSKQTTGSTSNNTQNGGSTKPSTEGTTKPSTQPPTTTKQPSNTVSGNYNTNYANEVLAIVNRERKNAGLSPLTMNANATNAAKVRAKEIVSKFDHTRPNGTSPFTALKENGVSYSTAGENIAYGQSSPSEVMNGWMNSSGHRANILKGNFKEIGIAAYYQNGKYYWVQLFIG